MATTDRNISAGMMPPLFLSVISTTIRWLIDEEELNRQVEAHVGEINRLAAMSDGELARLGIHRSEITAYVLSREAE